MVTIARRRPRTRELTESVGFDSKTRIDKEAGIVRGVKILGPESAHGYRYTQECMRNAVPLYEGKAVNVDHPEDRKKLGASRSYRDRFGKLFNAEYREGKGVFGDFKYNKGHVLAPQFEYDVENDPSNLGLSHNASGVASANGDFVESITHVRSVDLVADPATNVSLFEDKGGSHMALKLKKNKSRQRLMAEFLEGVSEHEELADLLEAATAPDEGASAAADTPLQATAKMAAAVFMDESMDVATKRKKIAKLLDLIDDSLQDAEAGAEGEEEPVPEGKGAKPAGGKLGKGAKPAAKPAGKELAEGGKGDEDLKTRLEYLEAKEEIRDLCESAGFTPSKVQLKSLLALEDEDERKELIESWGEKHGRTPNTQTLGPRGAAPAGSKPKSKPQGKELAESKIDEKELKALLV